MRKKITINPDSMGGVVKLKFLPGETVYYVNKNVVLQRDAIVSVRKKTSDIQYYLESGKIVFEGDIFTLSEAQEIIRKQLIKNIGYYDRQLDYLGA